MKVKNITFILIVLFSFSLLNYSSPFANPQKPEEQKKFKPKQLDFKYQKWLNLVHYIITEDEKDIFLKLTNNRDRDTFIKLFWQQRDPTPGTPENEFKDEHIKRFNYANKYFKYGSGQPGWRTDRGMIYILLGPPKSRHNHTNRMGLYPVKIWSYYGKKEWSLPTYFNIVFYQRYGSGEFELYDPNIDGPTSLMQHAEGYNMTQPERIYEQLYKLAPEVAKVAFSLIPEHGGSSYSLYMSPRSTLLLSRIKEIPRRTIETQYAKNFLDFKGIVKIDESINYIKNDFYYTIKYDKNLGLNLVHFSIKPKQLSVDYSEERDKYFFAFRLDVSLKKNDEIIYQYSKNYPFYYSDREVKEYVMPMGVAIEDVFPVPEGQYKMTILVQNSVKSEFSYVEKQIKVESPGENINLFGPYITYTEPQKDNTAILRAFKIGEYILKIEPTKRFSLSDDIYIFYGYNKSSKSDKKTRSIVTIKARQGYGDFSKTYEKGEIQAGRSNFYIIPVTGDLSPGVYNVKVKVLYEDSEVPLEIKDNEFSIAPLGNINHPMEAAKILDVKNRFLYYYWLASQYHSLGDFEKSESLFEKGFNLNKQYAEGIIKYAKLLLSKNNFDKAIEIVETIKGNEKYNFEYFSLLGKCYFGKRNYRQALDYLIKANEIYDSDYDLINTIGFTFLKLGNKKQAIDAFKASLSINKDQPGIKKILEKQQKSKKDK